MGSASLEGAAGGGGVLQRTDSRSSVAAQKPQPSGRWSHHLVVVAMENRELVEVARKLLPLPTVTLRSMTSDSMVLTNPA